MGGSYHICRAACGVWLAVGGLDHHRSEAPDVSSTFNVVRSKTVDVKTVAALSGTSNQCISSPDPKVGQCSGEVQPSVYATFTSRGVMTFDLTPLANDQALTVTAAVLNVSLGNIAGDPFATLGGKLLAEHVYFGGTYSDTSPTLSACFGLLCKTGSTTLATSGWGGALRSIDATWEVRDDLAKRVSRENRSQFRFRFPIPTNGSEVLLVWLITGMSSIHVTYEYP